ASGDPMGAIALVANLQCDISTSQLGGVPDFVAFASFAIQSGAAANCPSGGAFANSAPYGDANFVRHHYGFPPENAFPTNIPNSTHQSKTQVNFSTEACNNPVVSSYYLGGSETGPNPVSECGGDAGGFIVPVGTQNIGGDTDITIQSVTNNGGGT